MLPKLTIPPPEAPEPLPGYGLPNRPQLDWTFVAERMIAATNYWICTASPEGEPHAVPVWGFWHDNHFYFDGSPETLWARNLEANPAMSVHPPDAESVVIVEGAVRRLDDDDLTVAERDTLSAAYQAKYGMEGRPHYVLVPYLVVAWDSLNLGTMTRWRFE
jgi:nitroimidazol reductase NimA-like FMN-containing flavoprotein (pyridoxamine 5'-phosphate oxidase superfamily)